MVLYHGSPIGGLHELKPFLSEHGKPYIYFASDPLVALFYAVKPVPKPFSFYPYGFDKDGRVTYAEYYENAFYELYHGKTGYLYVCKSLAYTENPTAINCAYVCSRPVEVDEVMIVPDLYAFYREQAEKGAFRIRPRSEISEKEMRYVLDELRKDIEKYDFKSTPHRPMSLFLQTHFPNLWEEYK